MDVKDRNEELVALIGAIGAIGYEVYAVDGDARTAYPELPEGAIALRIAPRAKSSS